MAAWAFALLALAPAAAAARGAPLRAAGAGGPSSSAVCFRAREGCEGFRPVDLHAAYSLPLGAAAPQTIAIIGIEDDRRVERDLAVYDTEFELPACTRANGCFLKVNGRGRHHPLPPEATVRGTQETSMDVEVAHAICQSCTIALVEAGANSLEAVEEAVETAAVSLGASEISVSWAGPSHPRFPEKAGRSTIPGS